MRNHHRMRGERGSVQAWWPLLVAGLLAAGCAVPGPIPAGASPAGTYRGSLVGNTFDGPIVVELFRTADGRVHFTGRFTTELGDYHFRGEMVADDLRGKISLGLGTITGSLSPDGRRMEGVFRLAQNHGTWNAVLKE